MLNEFIGQLKYELDAFQLQACKFLERGKSVLVAAPTGAGKTTVAEFAIWLARSNQARTVYTSPIKALSNQKFAELVAQYGEEEVGLLTGDVNIRSDAPILVMTTEVLRNMIYEGSPTLDSLSHVILDEVHYLADRARGAVWEEIILHLPAHIRLVCLSATVSNAEEFGQWLHAVRGETEVIVSEVRPVPLYQHVFVKGQLIPLFINGRLNRDLVHMERPSVPGRPRRQSRVNYRSLVTELEVQSLLPAIVFIFSRKGCDNAVQHCLRDGVRLTNSQERAEIRKIVKSALTNFSRSDLYALGYNRWLEALEHGIAAHHAGLIPPFKSIIETLFQKKLVKLVFATETLALGINMPAKSVVIEQLEKFNGEARVPLLPGEFTQLTGRAGRRGIDTEGHAIIVWENRSELDHVATLASKRVYPLRSSFRPTYNMAVNLLERVDYELARGTLERSFAQFQADRDMVTLAEQVRAEQKSLAGYEKAASRSSGSDRKRWQERARKLRRDMNRRIRKLERRTGTIARVFDRVVLVLESLGYLTDNKPTWLGEMLRGIYGERDLLVAESVRREVWSGLNPAELAAMCCALVYEPRRDDEGAEIFVPGGSFQHAFAETLKVWGELDRLEEEANLARTDPPHPALSQAMIRWSRGAELESVLAVTHLSAGDFIRITKQTIDLLEQIMSLTEARDLAQNAREARDMIARGIVEISSRAA